MRHDGAPARGREEAQILQHRIVHRQRQIVRHADQFSFRLRGQPRIARRQRQIRDLIDRRRLLRESPFSSVASSASWLVGIQLVVNGSFANLIEKLRKPRIGIPSGSRSPEFD